MLLRILDGGHSGFADLALRFIAWRWGVVPDTQRVFWYRRSLFGKPFVRLFHSALRSPSEWTAAERELFGSFVSSQNQCPY